jgi:hypothetical protein
MDPFSSRLSVGVDPVGMSGGIDSGFEVVADIPVVGPTYLVEHSRTLLGTKVSLQWSVDVDDQVSV